MTKSLIINAHDSAGGAARLAYLLHSGLKNLNVDSEFLTQVKTRDDSSIITEVDGRGPFAKFERGWRYAARNSKGVLQTLWPSTATKALQAGQYDIYNFHWVASGMIAPETLARLKKPIVWSVHDMWPMAGTEHFPSPNNDRYITGYPNPSLLWMFSEEGRDCQYWHRKMNAYANLENLTVVSGSTWLERLARQSMIFSHARIETIPYGIDTKVFQPIDCRLARQLLGLEPDRKYVLFGAAGAYGNKRKGFRDFVSVFENLPNELTEKISILAFGSVPDTVFSKIPIPIHQFSIVKSDSLLSLIYNAADVFVAPYHRDNLPLTILEAMATATPVVGYDVGGLSDAVKTEQNGILVEEGNLPALQKSIFNLLNDKSLRQTFANEAFNTISKNHTQELQAQRYKNLFEDLTDEK